MGADTCQPDTKFGLSRSLSQDNLIESQTTDLFYFLLNLGCSSHDRTSDSVFHGLDVRIQRFHRQDFFHASIG
jgi:hypothetical protein